MSDRLTFQYGDAWITLEVAQADNGWRIQLPDGTARVVRARRLPGDILEIVLPEANGTQRVLRVPNAHDERETALSLDGSVYRFTRAAPASVRKSPRSSSGTLSAPMVGVVAAVHVVEGEDVEAYQALAAVEAMKVIATIEAPFAGVVRNVRIHVGQRVEHGAALMEVVPHAPANDKESQDKKSGD